MSKEEIIGTYRKNQKGFGFSGFCKGQFKKHAYN